MHKERAAGQQRAGSHYFVSLDFFPLHAIAMDSEKTNVSFLNPAVDHTTPNPDCDPDPGR